MTYLPEQRDVGLCDDLAHQHVVPVCLGSILLVQPERSAGLVVQGEVPVDVDGKPRFDGQGQETVRLLWAAGEFIVGGIQQSSHTTWVHKHRKT